MTQEFDPVGAVEAIERISNQVSVMAFDNGSCLHPCEPGPAAARAFIAAHPGKDLYFVVADLNDPLILGKPRKSDMFGSRVVWVDLDPPKKVEPAGLELWRSEKLNELDRSGLPQAHIIICSGRGLWCFWHLSRQVDAAEAEAINRALAQRLEGDKCHNIDRVARVPFTRNSKTGDIASVLREIEGEIAPEALPHTAPASAPAPIAASKIEVGEPLTSLDDLGQWDVDPRIRRIIKRGRDPDNPKSGDDSRSAWLWDGVLGLMRHGVPDDTILAILLDRRWRISESAYDNGRSPQDYATRQIERAREFLSDFIRNSKGGIISNKQHNIRLAFTKLNVSLSYDAFANRSLIQGLPGFGPALNDEAVRRLWFQISDTFCFQPTKDFFLESVLDITRQASFHPVRDYLGGLKWDGTPRLDQWLIKYGTAQDTPYVRAVSGIMLIAPVRRIRQPGVKFDEMPILEGPQGGGKSTALSILAGGAACLAIIVPSTPTGGRSSKLFQAVGSSRLVSLPGCARLQPRSSSPFFRGQPIMAEPPMVGSRRKSPASVSLSALPTTQPI